MMSKVELEREVKLLRQQMVRMEERCQQREDKLMKIFESLEPFLTVMTEAQRRALEAKLST